MRVGIYQDLRNPPAWRRPWAEHYRGCLDRVERAEALGLDSVWLTEQHFFEDGYLPQAHVYAAAVAERTSRIRIGTAIAPGPLRPAHEYAEQAALVDLISDGRYELGLGLGYRVPEFEAYGADMTRRYEVLEERLHEVRRLLETGGVMPPPVQQPLPLWAGVMGPRGARLAGRAGAGLLWFDRALLEPYREGLRAGGHAAQDARMAGHVSLILARDPEAAYARMKPYFAYQWQTYARYAAEGITGSLAPMFGGLDAHTAIDEVRTAGTPAWPRFDVVTAEEAVRRVREWLEGLPVVDAHFWDSVAGMPDDLVDEHLELLANEVRPAICDL